MTPVGSVGDLEGVVNQAAQLCRVPAAAVAVIDKTGTHVVASASADPEMTGEIGSVTKVMTATLVLQHVARGEISLDDPVAKYVDDFQLEPPEATQLVTIGDLLCHASGCDFDEFSDVGDGDDCLSRYVRDALAGEAWDRPGTRWNYSNGGYSLLGRLIEVIDGRTFDDALVARIADPLGLSVTTHFRVDPNRAVETGHLPDPSTGEIVEDRRRFPRSAGPAGGALATATDLAHFGHTLVSGGAELLPTEWASRMRTSQMPARFGSQGLGWLIDHEGNPYYHGGTVSQSANLLAIPGRATIGVVGNAAGGAVGIAMFVANHLFGPSAPAPTNIPEGEPALSPEACAGTYESKCVTQHLTVDGDGLNVRQEHTGHLADLLPAPSPFHVQSLGGGCYGNNFGLRWDFSDPDARGRATRLLTLRSHKRID